MNLANGLLGLGGLGAINAQSNVPGLLGKYYNTSELNKAKTKQGLLQAGIALLSQQPRVGAPYGFGETLGTALRGGLEGAQQAQQDYMNNAMQAYQMDRQAQDDAWQQKTRDRQLKAWDSEDQRKAAYDHFIQALPEDQKALAEQFPEQFGQWYVGQKFPKPQEPYTLSEGQVRFDGNNQPVAQGIPANSNDWTEVTLEDGVYAVNKKDPTNRIKIGARPDRNEGEGRQFSQEDKLRQGYIKEAKPFADLRTNYSRIKAANQDNTGASDIAMVYSFMKMLDPTSVVREGEFATAENAGGVPQQIQSMYNRVLDGQRLSPEVRKEFMQQADRQYQEQFSTYKQIQTTYKNLAQQYELDPAKVAPDLDYGVMPGSGTSPLTSPLVTPNGQTRKYNPLTGKLE